MSEWVEVEMNARLREEFDRIAPPGRTIEAIHIDPEAGVLRITLDDGGEVHVPTQRRTDA